MADALLAGLPRIVRAAEEIRLRGWLVVSVGAAAAAWWIVQWLLDQPVVASRTWLFALVAAVLGAVTGLLNVPRRVREGLHDPRFPSARVVYETRADGRDRRIRLSGALFLTVIVVLMFDALADWGGVTAGFACGAALAVGVADLVEARRWAAAERERDSELYVLVGANAFVASYGHAVIFEVPNPPARHEARTEL